MQNLVSLNNVISNAMISLGAENDSQKVIFYEWGNDCLRSMGFVDLNLNTFYGNITVGTPSLSITGISSMYINNISVKNTGTTDVVYPSFNSNYWGNTQNKEFQTAYNETYVVVRETSDSDDRLVFTSGMVNDGYDLVGVQYYKMPVDPSGSPLVQESFISPIVAYLDYRFAKWRQASDKQSGVTSQDIQLLYQLYDKEKNQAIIKKNRPDKIVVPGIGNGFGTFLNHPLL